MGCLLVIKAVSIVRLAAVTLERLCNLNRAAADRPQPAARRETKAADKLARHVALVGKARVGGNIHQTFPARIRWRQNRADAS